MRALLAACLLIAPLAAQAGDGRLLATGGATQFEGAAGGGLVPWAVLAGYGTRDEHGGTAFATHVDTGDYTLDVQGAAYTFNNRLELSFARQRLDLGTLQDQLSLPWATRMPQLSVGVQYKRLRDDALPLAVGARDGEGIDPYVAATKLFLSAAGGYPLLLNGTVRYSRANQAGLLGFGGDRRRDRTLLLEASAAVVLRPEVVVGIEYRQKPDNLGFAREDDWHDAFIAWFPNKHVALVAAYADLGSIAGLDDQRGGYLSLQVSY